uniref:Uncharacterized protein n=1 Tax=Haemonchus contortus TaxID=6289 RepID=A0A7I5EA46_HAECO
MEDCTEKGWDSEIFLKTIKIDLGRAEFLYPEEQKQGDGPRRITHQAELSWSADGVVRTT